MKNFKSLILGSAAGMLAVAGAQAADLPVKAKPVEYVKVCSAYGAGFYYIPGTDICLRVGGFIFSDFAVNNRGIAGEFGTGATRDRNDDWTSFRIRQALILDARTNTEYGTLRSYFAGGFQWDTANNGIGVSQGSSTTVAPNWAWYYNSAFIQFAGFTFGIAQSMFDFDPNLVMNTLMTKSSKYAPMIAYTAQLGSGISAVISMEDSTVRRNGIALTSEALTTGSTGYSSQFMPDFIANLRVQQAWGDAQVSAAIHQVKTSTIGDNNVDYGYAFLGGLNFKLPQIGAGDSFQIEGAYAKGAVEFAANQNPYSVVGSISYVTSGVAPILDLFDAFRVSGTQLDLSKSYSINTQFRHFWTPTLRSAIMYGYLKFDAPVAANVGGLPDGRVNQVAANLIWSPVKNLDIGTEIYWNDLKTSNSSNTATNASNDWWGGNFRVTRYW